MTLDAAVRAALARNASLRAARAGADEAAARATEAHATVWPRISMSESWQRGNQPVFVFSSLLSSRQFAASNFAIDALNHPDATGFFRASLGIEQLLYDGGRRRAAGDEAASRQEAATASAGDAAAAIAVATTQAFGRIVVADATRRAADEGLASAREDLARAERRRDAGLATEADVLALSVHVADLRQRTIQDEGDAAAARAELNRLMGNAVDAAIQIVESTAAPIVDLEDHPDIPRLIAEADRSRAEIARAAASERAAAAAERQAHAALLPQVAAQGAVDVSGTRFDDRASSWIVGGELRWSFSAGGAESASRKAAAASVARARAEAEDVRAAVHVEVVAAAHRLLAARARDAVGRAAVEQAKEAQRIIRDRFDAGVAPLNDVLRAATAVLDAETNRASAAADIMSAAAMLRRAIGRTP